MNLDLIDIVNGVTATIFVILSILVGLGIILKYFKYKKRVFLFFGITWILIVEPWYPFIITYLVAVSTGEILSLQAKLILGHILIPFGVAAGLTAFTELKYEQQQKKILFLYGIFGVIFYMVFFFFLYAEPTLIAKPIGQTYIEYSPIFKAFLLGILVIILIVGIIFTRVSIKSDDAEVRLKGKMLLIAFIIFSIGTFIEAMIPKDITILIITRILLIFSAFSFYAGFYLPSFMKRFFIKE